MCPTTGTFVDVRREAAGSPRANMMYFRDAERNRILRPPFRHGRANRRRASFGFSIVVGARDERAINTRQTGGVAFRMGEIDVRAAPLRVFKSPAQRFRVDDPFSVRLHVPSGPVASAPTERLRPAGVRAVGVSRLERGMPKERI